MKRIVHTALILFIAVLFNFSVAAQIEGNPANWCRNGLFPRESSDYRLARVKAARGERVYFRGDERDDCPQGANCRRKAYLVAGDEVVVSRQLGPYACAWYQPAKGAETVGWLPAADLEYRPAAEPTPDDWTGEWRYGDAGISIAKAKSEGVLSVTGSALWRGIGNNVHVGELDYEGRPQANLLVIGDATGGEYDCRVALRRVGRYLIAADNLNCGGVNVTFSGVYRQNK